MKNKYNLAFWGAGHMAAAIIDTVDKTNRFYKYAVASRKKENAISFANHNVIEKVLTYDELLLDNKIDLVYISTPTKLHYEHIKRCILAHKNVICEKPLVENEEEAKEIIELAKLNNVLLIDGLWTMYMPIVDQLKKSVLELGVLKYASASLGWPSLKKSEDGTLKSSYDLWDYEIYPLTVMNSLFGSPIKIDSKSKEICKMKIENISILEYDGFKSRIFSSLKRKGTYCLFVIGTKGALICRKYWFGKYPIFIWKYPFKFKKINMHHKFTGYEYELYEAARCLDNGTMQSDLYSHEKTIELMRCKDQLLI